MSKEARILIVDDNESLRRTLSFILEREGYTVVTAQDGPEAIKLVEQQPFNVIFMDIKMPVMDGVQAYKEIKQIRPEAAVIMMTAYAVEDLVQDALKEGAFAVVYKPADLDQILTLINQVMERKEGAFVLVVDDNENICKTLYNILGGKGYQVGIAHSGEAAITMAEEREYDIYLIDMKLPAINGLETYLSIHETHPQAIAIIMTGYRQEMSELVHDALEHTAYACLDKPLDIELLFSMLSEILGKMKKWGGRDHGKR